MFETCTWLEAILKNRIFRSGNPFMESAYFVNMAIAMTPKLERVSMKTKHYQRYCYPPPQKKKNLGKGQKHLPTESNHQMHQQPSVAPSLSVFIRLKKCAGVRLPVKTVSLWTTKKPDINLTWLCLASGGLGSYSGAKKEIANSLPN